MLSLKQIGTICFTTILSLFISPSYSYITNSSNCDEDVLNTTSAPAALEANYSANTINTTWYSNGTALSGDEVPSSCIYDDALTPPTPAARPGYMFGGWTLKPPPCLIPSSLASTNGSSGGFKSGDEWDVNTSEYGLTEDNTWGVTWSNGDKVTGVALCSQTSGTYPNTGTPDETGSGETQYCWCKATHYTANNAQQCSLSSPAWVFRIDRGSAANCATYCAYYCAYAVQYYNSYAGFRSAIFTGLVAQ